MPHKCANPECETMIEDERKKFCSPECHKKFRELRGVPENIEPMRSSDSEVEECLEYMGINKSSYGKPFAYRNWELITLKCKEWSGERFSEQVKPKLRSILGMQHRYVEEYLDTLLAWGIIRLNGGHMIFIGVEDKK